MSEIARTWAAAQDTPNRNAHEVLKELAQWADADGETWVLVSVLAKTCKCTERTVQRGLADLKRCGLLIDTGEKKRRGGRHLPIYQLPLATGFANIMQAIRAETEAANAVADPVDEAPMGDSGVTHREALGVTVVSPHGCQPCHPTGDSGVTQIGKRNTQDLTVNAGACAIEPDQGVDGPHLVEASAAYGRKAGQGRVVPLLARSSWQAALAKSGWTPGRMAAAVTAAVARDPDFDRGKAVSLHRWLDEERWRSWDTSGDGAAVEAAGSARATWSGPNRVREIVFAVMGQGGVASYLDPAGWDAEASAVIAATGLAASRLRDAVGRALAAEGFKVCLGSGARG